MKGWVYIISNQAMPDLIKIGFSTKDPALLASELNHTGSPHPYVVDYEVLIDHPRDIERKVHRKLSGYREGREWLRCAPEFAISAIQQIAGGQAIVESFKRADRLKAEEVRRQQEKERQRQERVEAIWRDREMQIRSAYEQRLQQAFPEYPVWGYLLIRNSTFIFGFGRFGIEAFGWCSCLLVTCPWSCGRVYRKRMAL